MALDRKFDKQKFGERKADDYDPEPDLRLPDNIELAELAGEGMRSRTWKIRYQGRTLALKVYRQRFIEKYRKRYKLDIARFEYERNLAFRNIPELTRYAAEPVTTIGVDDEYSKAFIQEFMDAPRLKDLAPELGGTPREVMKHGRFIVEKAAEHGLHDLDINDGNIKLYRDEQGWYPRLYDFNLVPQHMHAPNPLRALEIKLGLRDKSHRDYETLRRWEQLGNDASNKA